MPNSILINEWLKMYWELFIKKKKMYWDFFFDILLTLDGY